MAFQISARQIRLLLTLLVAAAFAGLYWRGAVRQMNEVNLDPDVTDQDAYIAYARELRASNYTYIGDHNRMPLYPVLQSLFLEPEMKRREIFIQGKLINLYLSLPLLAGIAWMLNRRFSGLHTLNLMLVTGFMVFLFKAGWFQAELLFYFLNFCLFVELLQLLNKPSYPLAILTGVTAGLAHLTKASILPGLAIFGLVWAIQLGWGWLRRKETPARSARERAPQLLAGPLTALIFLAVVFPYISTSKRVFGQYFYNVNSTFYIWYDSWEEARLGTRAHGDRVGWPDMPPEEIPSLGKYLREHTAGQIAGRFINGARLVGEEVAHSYGYLPYVLIYTGLLALAALRYPRQALALGRAHAGLLLFSVVYFIVYALLYFWYAPIAFGNRLVLAQFLPLMFAISAGLHALLKDKSLRLAGSQIALLDAANLLILAFLVVDIYAVLTVRAGALIGGD